MGENKWVTVVTTQNTIGLITPLINTTGAHLVLESGKWFTNGYWNQL